MSKKLKDWYDVDYLKSLSNKIKEETPHFDEKVFLSLTREKIDDLEFGQRQELIAIGLKESLHLEYKQALEIFNSILGPELTSNEGNFTEGYWLWPIGKYVELYGVEDLAESLFFSKELTKRFTSEYCMRPLIKEFSDQVIPVLIEWSTDPNLRVRRLASECLRIRLPWAKKMMVALDYFEEYYLILSNLKDDVDRYIQKSVANNLNDLYKESPEHFKKIIVQWENMSMSKETKWIIKHGSRNVKTH